MHARLLIASLLFGVSLVACGNSASTPAPIGQASGGIAYQQALVSRNDTVDGSVFTLGLAKSTLDALNLASSPTVTLPLATAPSGTIVVGNANPVGIPALSIARTTLRTQSATINGATALVYETFKPSTALSLDAQAQLTFSYTFATPPSTSLKYHIAYYNGSKWFADSADVGVISGNKVSVAVTTPLDLAFAQNGTYAVALYQIDESSTQASGSTVSQTLDALPAPTTSDGVSSYTLSALTTNTLSSLGLALPPTIALPSGIAINGSTTISNTNPSDIAAFGFTRKTQSATIKDATPLLYVGLKPKAAFSIPANAKLSFSCTLAGAPSSGVAYRLAFFNGISWLADTADVAAISGNSVTIAATTPLQLDLAANGNYAVVLYASPVAPTGSASPNPGATATPSAVPTSAATANPLSESGTLSVAPAQPLVINGTYQGASLSLSLPAASTQAEIPYQLSVRTPDGVNPPVTGVATIFAYLMLTPTSTVTFPSGATVSATGSYPGSIPAGNYHVAVSTDGINWLYGLGNSSIDGATIRLQYTSTSDISLSALQAYYLALYR